MRKNQIKQLFLKFIVFVGLAFLTFTCEQDKIVNETQEESILKNQKAPTIRTFSLDNIGERFNDIAEQLNIRKYLKKSKDLSYVSRTSYDTLGITIYTDEIKEVTIDDYISYTMRMATPETDSTSFYNVTIEDDNGVTEMYVIKYTPDQAWLDNKNQPYEGYITTTRVNNFTHIFPDSGGGTSVDNLGYNYTASQGSPYYPTDCQGTVYVKMTTLTLCTCADHIPSICNGCPSWYTTEIPYYYCEEYIDPIDDTIQNGNINTDTTTGGTVSPGNNSSNINFNLITVTLTPVICSPKPIGDLNQDCILDAEETYLNIKQCLEQNDYTLNQAQSDYLLTNFFHSTSINNYLFSNSCNTSSRQKIAELLNFLNENEYSEEAIIASNIALDLDKTNNLTNFFTEEYENILINNLPPDSGLIGVFLKYQEHVIREMITIMMTEYDDGHQFSTWELFKITLRAQKEGLHFGLDAAGMAPGVGIVFDVLNGIIYTVEMDWGNATLSYTAAIPIAGQWVTTAKWAKRTIQLSNGKKVYLKAYNLIDGTIKFSNRGQLRKVLEITDSSIHAHHLIPYSLGIVNDISNMTSAQKLIQNAAKSNNVWHINDIYNGIPMPNNLHLSGHSNYTSAIQSKLNEIYDNLQDPDNLIDAYDALMEFCNYLKNAIQNNPTFTSGDLVNIINNYIP